MAARSRGTHTENGSGTAAPTATTTIKKEVSEVLDEVAEQIDKVDPLVEMSDKLAAAERDRNADLAPKTSVFRLVNWDQAPRYLQDNPYIHTGYRTNFTTGLCVKSVGRLHNESCNIWSHLIPVPPLAALSAAFFYYDYDHDTGMLGLYAGALAIAFALSAVWHTFTAHSQHAYVSLLKLDLTGMSLMATASFYPPVYYVIPCYPMLQIFYLSIITSLCMLGIFLPLFKDISSARWRPVRYMLYGSMAVFSMMPTIHLPWLVGWDKSSDLLARFCLSYVCYTMGLFHYVTRYPEKWRPGSFDIWFPSHTWWHIWGVIGGLVHLHTSWLAYQKRHEWAICPF